jgi:hypothetical protein
MHRFWSILSVAVLAVWMVGCDVSDAVAIRIRLDKDFSGVITVSSLLIPQEGGPIERGSQGVVWQNRASLVSSAGRFENLSSLKIEDITFSTGVAPDGMSYVRVALPRGPKIQWAKAMTPASPAERQRAVESFDPTNKKDVGSAIKLQIDLPSPVIGHGVSGKPAGLNEEATGTRATLVVPVEAALAKNDPLVWHLTWQK